jgi:hypothetical protein
MVACGSALDRPGSAGMQPAWDEIEIQKVLGMSFSLVDSADSREVLRLVEEYRFTQRNPSPAIRNSLPYA